MKGASSDYDAALTILKGKRKGKRILGGRILDCNTVSRKIQPGHWKYSSQIHLLELSHISSSLAPKPWLVVGWEKPSGSMTLK